MKKIFIAALLILGGTAAVTAQTTPAKTAAVKQPAKTSLTKSQSSPSVFTGALTHVGKTSGTNAVKTNSTPNTGGKNKAQKKQKKLVKAQKKQIKASNVPKQ